MKRLLVVLIVMGVVAVGWWAAQTGTQQNVFQVVMAFGFPKDGRIELHAVASMGMTATEPPRLDPSTGRINWAEWVDEHFDLRDAAGKRENIFFKSGSDDVIPVNKVLGAAEGYLFAKVKQGADYTFDYIPKRAEARRFRHTFTAPTGNVPVDRINFKRM